MPNSSNPVIQDFEFTMTEEGGVPVPHTLCALELGTGKIHRYGPSELAQLDGPPFPSDQTLIAFAADAELSCYLALGWPMPENVIDLRIEHMMLDINTGDRGKGQGLSASLESALAFYGMSHAVENKKEMQKLAGERIPQTPEEVEAMKIYCYEDIAATKKLWDVMEPKLDEDGCLWRGRYMRAVTTIHARGIPMDMRSFNLIKAHANDLRMMWIRKLDPNCEIFDENGTYKVKRFTEYLRKRGLLDMWPKTDKKREPSTASDAIRDVTAIYPSNTELAKLGELFNTVNLLKKFSLTMDSKGRNRAQFFNAFGTSSGRNAPHGYIFAPAKWIRSLIKPGPGMAVNYQDWVSMEVGVGANLSGDEKLMEAYLSGDAHMALAKQGNMVPQDASKDASKSPYACGPKCGKKDHCKNLPSCTQFAEHQDIRSQYKTCNLAAMYGAIVQTLVDKGLTRAQASRALGHHHKVYATFWEWIEDRIEVADMDGMAVTFDGWSRQVNSDGKKFNPRSVGNFFVQANSAAIMRLAAVLATERNLGICAVVHDAFLLEAPIWDMARQVAELKACMDEASATLLDGFVLGVDGWEEKDWIVYPNRYLDERGKDFWEEVETALATLESQNEEATCLKQS